MKECEDNRMPAVTNQPLHILALPGSLRRGSFNRMLCEAAARLAPAGLEIEVFGDVDSIPLFNEDVEAATGYGPEPVRELRRRVAAADGLLVATPEYNQSLSGVLKNILDWLSRPGPGEVLVGKPVAVMGASSGPWGTRLSQKEVRHVLLATGSLVLPQPMLFVRNSAESFDACGRLTDGALGEKLETVLAAFTDWIQGTKISIPSAEAEMSEA